jgi:hypothetical protein
VLKAVVLRQGPLRRWGRLVKLGDDVEKLTFIWPGNGGIVVVD